VTREQKLALIVGFSLILLVGVLISDHLSRARSAQVAGVEADDQVLASATRPNLPEAVHPGLHEAAQPPAPSQPVGGSMSDSAPAPETPDSLTADGGTLIAMGPATASQSGPTIEPVGSITDATRQLLDQIRDGARSALENGISDAQLPAAASVDRSGPAGSPAPQPNDAPPAKAPTTWYTVKAGETLFQIAKRQYGSGQAWKQIADLNKGRVSADGGVKAGVRIELYDALPGAAGAATKTPAKDPAKPATKPADKPVTRPGLTDQRIAKADTKANPKGNSKANSSGKPEVRTVADAPRTYTVRKGDSLGEISQRLLGTMRRKDEILDLNKSLVDDEDSIQVGMVLKMPAR
jgi:nucleoid-associated protein YgaU